VPVHGFIFGGMLREIARQAALPVPTVSGG